LLIDPAVTAVGIGVYSPGGDMSAANVFVYGTLLAEEVVQAILKRIPTTVPAILWDYKRVCVRYRTYPAIIPAKGVKLHGKVLLNLGKEEVDLLDQFEDAEYKNTKVEVLRTDTNQLIEANVYVWCSSEHSLDLTDWDYQQFREKNLRVFLSGLY